MLEDLHLVVIAERKCDHSTVLDVLHQEAKVSDVVRNVLVEKEIQLWEDLHAKDVLVQSARSTYDDRIVGFQENELTLEVTLICILRSAKADTIVK